MELTSEELYEMIKEDEASRLETPCCENCKYFYSDYGTDYCQRHDYPKEESKFDRCKDWR